MAGLLLGGALTAAGLNFGLGAYASHASTDPTKGLTFRPAEGIKPEETVEEIMQKRAQSVRPTQQPRFQRPTRNPIGVDFEREQKKDPITFPTSGALSHATEENLESPPQQPTFKPASPSVEPEPEARHRGSSAGGHQGGDETHTRSDETTGGSGEPSPETTQSTGVNDNNSSQLDPASLQDALATNLQISARRQERQPQMPQQIQRPDPNQPIGIRPFEGGNNVGLVQTANASYIDDVNKYQNPMAHNAYLKQLNMFNTSF